MQEEIKRGDIFWVNWSPGRGSEQGGLRPVLVIQNDIGNEFSPTTIVAALTTAEIKPYPFLVKIKAGESGLPRDSIVNLSTILTVDKVRLVKQCGQLKQPKMVEVNEAIKTSLGLP
ncbi:MAG: type II toxin-antitoxin system PemK/MazF family toxin [Dehalococcoidales bacterium]|nr:type II toxin-antitoxin system PemK/MazF family toxin [Dehalococcoidales bacterium]